MHAAYKIFDPTSTASISNLPAPQKIPTAAGHFVNSLVLRCWPLLLPLVKQMVQNSTAFHSPRLKLSREILRSERTNLLVTTTGHNCNLCTTCPGPCRISICQEMTASLFHQQLAYFLNFCKRRISRVFYVFLRHVPKGPTLW